MVKRYYNEQGQVAVLYSPGYGAGWSTWAGPEDREFALFDRGLVALALRNATEDEVKQYLATTRLSNLFTFGWFDITVAWVYPGTRFSVEEYDGSESLTFVEDLSFTA